MSNMPTDKDRAEFLREGYLVIRGAIPPGELPELRRQCEVMVQRQQTLWAAAAAAATTAAVSTDPRRGTVRTGTVAAEGAQPRLFISYPPMCEQIDRATSKCVDVWTSGLMHRACSFLLGVEDAALTEVFLMCSPKDNHDHLRDWLGWHRDFSPSSGVPLQALTENMQENGPTYVQLNLPLYDDDVLWIVPRSHHRLTTPDELAAMAAGLVGESRSLHAPLPGSVQVCLQAGDLAVYLSPTMLHWGSSYQSLPLRRTLHGGYSTNVGASLGPDIWPELDPSSAAAFARWQRGSSHRWVGGHWIEQRGADTATSHQAHADAIKVREDRR
jgi:hypothetical protein